MPLRRSETANRVHRALKASGWALMSWVWLIFPATAQSGPPAYSADAHYRAPDGSESVGRVVKSGADMRLEFVQGDRPVVQIIRRAEGVMYVLDPGTKTYFEVRGAPDPNAIENGYAPPCEADTGLTCQFIGNETTSGISAELWEVGQPGQAASRILWDGARHRALRQEHPDGTMMSLTFEAMEQVAGRNAEHWRITFSMPGQPVTTGHWYYDPELRVELREELPSGELRTLENIVVGPIDVQAFTVPSGWSETAPAQAPN